MPAFQNILVGIDIDQYDPTSSRPSAVARGVVEQALWLASRMSARLTFFSALDLTPETLPHLDETDYRHLTTTAETNAARVLRGLVEEARRQGIEATDKLSLGAGWLELVRQVMRDRHDLLLVGTRDRTGMARMLFGSTAVKLVRRCPCPVWVVKPDTHRTPLQILVASDLSPVGEVCLSLATSLARLTSGTVHLLHVVDFPLDRRWSTGLPDAREQAYRRDLRQRASKSLQAQIDAAGARDLAPAVQAHLVDEPGGMPDEGIRKFIDRHSIDLLVMGTIGRGGLVGAMIGNTAERLLPELSCSLLAVKPAGFVTPVRL